MNAEWIKQWEERHVCEPEALKSRAGARFYCAVRGCKTRIQPDVELCARHRRGEGRKP